MSPTPNLHALTLGAVPGLFAAALLQAGGGISAQGAGATDPAAAVAACGATSLQDTGGAGCITASSTPTVGSLFPLGPKFNVTAAGRIGIGTLSPAWPLHAVASQGVFRLDSTAAANGSVVELRNQAASSAFLGAINFVNSVGAHTGQIAYESDDELTFRVGGSEQGRIGIDGMTLPGLRVYDHPGGGGPNVIGGSPGNIIPANIEGATIAGGGADIGDVNAVFGGAGFVGGGRGNIAGGLAGRPYAVVVGGQHNEASGDASFVGGGESNVASGVYSCVAGGYDNWAAGYGSFAVGHQNLAASNSSYAIGSACEATGNGSLAMGILAWAHHDGSIVLSDGSGAPSLTPVASTGDDQFVVRAAGGVWLGTNSAVNIPAGRFINTSTGAYLSTGGAWTNASDRDQKVDVESLDSRAVLEKVVGLPLHSWSYAQNPCVRHAGPMAQDFHAAFGLGADERSIATIDADGVALAAIQGLHALVEQQAARIAALEARLAGLEGPGGGLPAVGR